MVASESFFKAGDGVQIFVRTWEPEAGQAARGVVHIHHGLGEHSGRYGVFAELLRGAGFAVVAHDARGHGRTSEAEGSPGLGRIACGKEGAVPRMVMDFAELIAETQAARPSLPVLLFGHSFGTVVTRLTLCGTAAPPPARIAGVILMSAPARIVGPLAGPFKVILGGLHMVHGEHGVSKLPHKLTFDQYNSQCLAAIKHEGPVNGWEWLNRDATEVQKYIDDPFCGHEISVGFYTSAVKVSLDLKAPATYKALPADLPICVLAGEQDFCAIDALGVPSYTRIQQELASAGKATPKVVVYPKARHELMVELNAEEVRQDALSFFLSCLAGGTGAGAGPRSRL